MTNEELRNVVRDHAVASQLVDKLPKLPEGIQKITVVSSDNRTRNVRAVRLRRVGNKLKLSGATE